MTGEGNEKRAGEGRRPIVYCIVPAELAAKLHEPLAAHFREDPGVEVIVERRRAERRAVGERRRRKRPRAGEERRILRTRNGRRVGERRAELVEVEPRPLPRRARRHADSLRFVERIEPSAQRAEDEDTARLVARIQAGDSERFGDLYSRYFSRVYSYLRVALDDPHEAEDAAQQVFIQVLESLPGYERRRQPFRAWLFTIVRNYAVSHLRKMGRIEVVDPAQLDREREDEPSEEEVTVLNWLTDRDLTVLVERMPLPQRQVLLLRFAMDLSLEQTAELLGRNANDVAQLQSRATTFLRERLTALGRAPKQPGTAKMKAWLPPAQVLRNRRSALG